MLGLISGALKVAGKIKTFAGNIKKVVKAGNLQGGFSIKGGDQTDQNKAGASVIKSVPVIVWAAVGAFFLIIISIFAFKRK